MKISFYHRAVPLLTTLLISLQPEPTRGATTTTPASSAHHPSLRPDITAKLQPDPVGFIPNLDQLSNNSVRFTVRDQSVTAHFTDTGFVLQNGETTTIVSDGISWTTPIAPRWEVVGAQPVQPRGGRTYDHTVSYFRGRDRAKWHANVPAYRDLSYPDILPGTEMRFESREDGNIVIAGNSFSADLPETAGGFGTGPGVNSNEGTWYRARTSQKMDRWNHGQPRHRRERPMHIHPYVEQFDHQHDFGGHGRGASNINLQRWREPQSRRRQHYGQQALNDRMLGS